MTQLGYLGIDQYGTHYKLEKHPRKELVEKTGYKHVSKMHCDTKEGDSKEVGYIVGPLWINVYRVMNWKD